MFLNHLSISSLVPCEAVAKPLPGKTALGSLVLHKSLVVASKALLEERDAHNASRGGVLNLSQEITCGNPSFQKFKLPWDVPIVQVMLEVQAQMGEYAQLRGA